MNLGRKLASLFGVSSMFITQLAAEEAGPLIIALSSTTISGYVDVGSHWNPGTGRPAPAPIPLLTFGSEILWQHSDGRIAKWLMSGPVLIQSHLVQIPPSPFPGVRNPIALDQSSIYFRHDNYLWKNGSFINVAPIIPMKDQTFAGAANLIGTQNADLIWTSPSSLMVWEMDGSRVVQQHVTYAPFKVPADAKVVGLNDFNADNSVDLLWQDTRGFVWVTLMDGIRVRGTVLLNNGRPANPKWILRGTGEFNNDRKPDLLWQHEDGRLGTPG